MLFDLRQVRTGRACAAALALAALVPLAACSKSISTQVNPGGKGGDDQHPIKIQHWSCDAPKSGGEDTNGDGRVDAYTATSGGKQCHAADLNFDGKFDRFTYTDGGTLLRIESDYDRDGRIDEIQNFKGGVLVRKDREMNLDGKFDTWDFYEDGKLVRRDRDTDADGRVDQWWTFPDPAKLDCPVVASDKDGDGRPDVGSEMDMCKVSDDDPANLLATNARPGASGSAPPPPTTAPPPPPPAASSGKK